MTDIAEEIPPGTWMSVVAAMLPRVSQSPTPFTFGEAVEEYGRWARLASAKAWGYRANQRSLHRDVEEGLSALGPRSLELVSAPAHALMVAERRDEIGDVAERLVQLWRSDLAIQATFRDLCERASRRPVVRELEPLASAVHSQLGPGSREVLNPVAGALGGNPWRPHPSDPADPAGWLRQAESRLTNPAPTGEVVVWLTYRRAEPDWRLDIGPIAVLRADWLVHHARNEGGRSFPERNELREVLDGSFFGENTPAKLGQRD